MLLWNLKLIPEANILETWLLADLSAAELLLLSPTAAICTKCSETGGTLGGSFSVKSEASFNGGCGSGAFVAVLFLLLKNRFLL